MKTRSIQKQVKEKKGNSVRLFIPAKLIEGLDEALSNNPPKFPGWKRENFLFLLGEIVMAPAYKKRKELTKDGYTILHSKILQLYIHEYKKYLDYLYQNNFIKIDSKYIRSQRSKAYKIENKYVDVVKSIYIQSTPLSKQIKRKRYLSKKQNTRQYGYLRKWMDGLEINTNQALDFLEALRDYRIENPSARTWDAKNNRYKDPLNQYNIGYMTVKHLENNEIYFHVDNTVGRLHTNLTNIQSDLRHFITWKGQKLVNIDISNSQPYISCKLFSNSFYKTDNEKLNLQESIKKLIKIESQEINKHKTKKHSKTKSQKANKNLKEIYNNYLMLAKTIQPTDIQDDTKRYIDLVKQGQLYDFLQDSFSKKLGIQKHSRKEVKASVFQVLFTDNRFIGQMNAAPKRLFKELFPNVYRVFAEYKRKDASFLPRLLQHLEATLILDIICKRISEERPDVPLFTIHDSITTTIPNVEYVKEVMTEELTRHVGIRPNLKTEYWNPSVLAKEYPSLFLFLPADQCA